VVLYTCPIPFDAVGYEIQIPTAVPEEKTRDEEKHSGHAIRSCLRQLLTFVNLSGGVEVIVRVPSLESRMEPDGP
jgi:hypothetical protein